MPTSFLAPKVMGTVQHTDQQQRVIMLNNAATTPPFESTMDTLHSFLQTYGALHRGAGPNATITYEKTNQALKDIRTFLGTSDDTALLFTHNTSSAINLFIRLLDFQEDDIIFTSVIEHTSNNLPWRHNTKAQVIYIEAFPDGSLDYEDLERKAQQYGSQLRLLAITGASNLSGYVPDIERIAAIAHTHNALFFVDAAQLAPHRPIHMEEQGIDALAFSAHKVYAPFGLGVLALPKAVLERIPVDPGGGSIDMISDRGIIWAPPEIRHQTGTWNVPGIIATAASCNTLRKVGWDDILEHEATMVSYAAEHLATVPGITLYIEPRKYTEEHRIGTFVFNLQGYHHAHLSAILEHEYQIETRAGTICNHILVRRWLQISDTEQTRIEKEIIQGNRLASYGIVRASIGIHNTTQDIDALVAALTEIHQKGPGYTYTPAPTEETYELNNHPTQ